MHLARSHRTIWNMRKHRIEKLCKSQGADIRSPCDLCGSTSKDPKSHVVACPVIFQSILISLVSANVTMISVPLRCTYFLAFQTFCICFLLMRFWDMYSFALAVHVGHVHSCAYVCSCVRVQNIFMVAELRRAGLRHTCRPLGCGVAVAQACNFPSA